MAKKSEYSTSQYFFLVAFNLSQQSLVNKRADQPDAETDRENDGKRKVAGETEIDGNEKKNAGDYSPECTPSEACHQSEITRIISVKPDKNNEAGQGHRCNEAGQ